MKLELKSNKGKVLQKYCDFCSKEQTSNNRGMKRILIMNGHSIILLWV